MKQDSFSKTRLCAWPDFERRGAQLFLSNMVCMIIGPEWPDFERFTAIHGTLLTIDTTTNFI